MKKQELLHLHALLDEAARQYAVAESYGQVEKQDVDVYETKLGDYLEEYESLGVGPVDIRKSRPDHEEAVFTLLDNITDYLEEEEVNFSKPAIRKPADD